MTPFDGGRFVVTDDTAILTAAIVIDGVDRCLGRPQCRSQSATGVFTVGKVFIVLQIQHGQTDVEILRFG